jgi:hypothetical protein
MLRITGLNARLPVFATMEEARAGPGRGSLLRGSEEPG